MAAMFLTGFAGLLYQILWIRTFSSILGGTTLSISCVIAHFMLGLGLGTASAPKLLQRDSQKQLPLYSLCELAIVLVIALGFAVLMGAPEFLSQILRGTSLPKLASHFLVTGIFIFPATFLMGLSFPLMSYKFSSARDHQWLYAANCLGGALGALCSYVVLIYNWGLSGALYFGFALNIFAAILFFRQKFVFTVKSSAQETPAVVMEVGEYSPKVIKYWALALSALSGFFVLSLEQIWFRLAHLFLGGRVYVHSLVLAVLLLTLAVGAFLSPRLSRLKTSEQLKAVLFILRMTGLFAAMGFVLLPQAVAVGIDLAHPYAKTVQGIFLLTLLVVAVLPGLLLGLCFPLSLKVIQSGMSTALQRTRSLSQAVYINTFASVMGSLISTYVLFSWLGTVGSLKFLFVSLIVLGLLGSVLFLKGPSRFSTTFVSVMLIAFIGTRPVSLNPAAQALFESEDEFGYLNVIPLKPKEGFTDQRWGMFHNYTSLVAPYGFGETSVVQKNLAIFPSLFAKNLDDVLVVGMGYGLTTESFAAIPEIKKITSVELLPQVLKAQNFLSFKNTEYLKDPRLENIADDGRSFIALSQKKWDVITVNVDPYGPGTTYLMSKNFYKTVRGHLNEGGVYAQLLFGAERDLQSLIYTAKASFPYFLIMPGYSNDGIIFLGSNHPFPEWSKVSLHRVKGLLPSYSWDGDVLSSNDEFSYAEKIAASWVEYIGRENPTPVRMVTDDNLLVETSRTKATDLFLSYPKDY